jgi:hypothetical protein
MGIFEDFPRFDMHENLMQLSKFLFNGEGEVTENVAIHQSDPVSCGVFVCRALEKLYQGKPVHKALYFNPSQESIADTRRRIGDTFTEIMEKRYPPIREHGQVIISDFFEKPKQPVQKDGISKDFDGWVWE